MVRPTRLSVQCADTEELHLHIRNKHSLKTNVYPMKLGLDGAWEIHVDLEPGAYLYRFYRRSGTSLIYHSPAGGPHPMANAWDATISIPLVNEGKTRVRFASENASTQADLLPADPWNSRLGSPVFD